MNCTPSLEFHVDFPLYVSFNFANKSDTELEVGSLAIALLSCSKTRIFAASTITPVSYTHLTLPTIYSV